jgi:hypothetical protein
MLQQPHEGVGLCGLGHVFAAAAVSVVAACCPAAGGPWDLVSGVCDTALCRAGTPSGLPRAGRVTGLACRVLRTAASTGGDLGP